MQMSVSDNRRASKKILLVSTLWKNGHEEEVVFEGGEKNLHSNRIGMQQSSVARTGLLCHS